MKTLNRTQTIKMLKFARQERNTSTFYDQIGNLVNLHYCINNLPAKWVGTNINQIIPQTPIQHFV